MVPDVVFPTPPERYGATRTRKTTYGPLLERQYRKASSTDSGSGTEPRLLPR